MSLGRNKEAEEMILLALTSAPDNADLFCLLARSRLDQQKPKAAEEAAQQAMGLAPEDPEARILLTLALLQRNRLRMASKVIAEAIELDPEEAFCYALKARILAEQGNDMAALNAAEFGLSLDPEEEVCQFYRSLILSKMGRHREADEANLEVLGEDPDETHNHSARGWILLQAGDAEGAETHFLQALRIDAENEDAKEGLAHALKAKNLFVGWLMRLSLQLGRLNTTVLIGGILVAIGITRLLEKSDNVFVSVLGLGISTIIVLIGGLWIIHAPLGSLALWLSRTGRLAQSALEKKALMFALLPLCGGLVLYVLWALNGSRAAPLGGCCWLCAAACLFASISEPSPWLRRRLLVPAMATVLIAFWVTFGAPFILAPLAKETVSLLGEDSKEAAVQKVQELFDTRRLVAVYPTLASLLIVFLLDYLKNWLRGFSPDEDWKPR